MFMVLCWGNYLFFWILRFASWCSVFLSTFRKDYIKIERVKRRDVSNKIFFQFFFPSFFYSPEFFFFFFLPWGNLLWQLLLIDFETSFPTERRWDPKIKHRSLFPFFVEIYIENWLILVIRINVKYSDFCQNTAINFVKKN